MQKVFIEKNQINNEQITLMGEDVKHIVSVLRMKIGEQIQVGVINSLEKYLTEIQK